MMQSDDLAEQSIADLKAIIRNLERQIEDQIQWLKDMTPQLAALHTRNSGLNEFIIESLQDGAHSRGFTMVVRNCPRDFLKEIKLDMSKYIALESPVFDIVMDAGYSPARLCDLNRAIQNVFTFNYCLPYMPMWRTIVARITKLARTDQVTNVDWNAAVRIFDVSCSQGSDYIQRHDDLEPWIAATKKMRATMVAAGSIVQAD